MDESPAKRMKAAVKEEKPTLPDITLPSMTDAKFDTFTHQHASPGKLDCQPGVADLFDHLKG